MSRRFIRGVLGEDVSLIIKITLLRKKLEYVTNLAVGYNYILCFPAAFFGT